MSQQEPKRTELSEVGEFGLIKILTGGFKTNQESTIKSVGDDAAVVNHVDLTTVVSTDLLVEGIHFDLMYVPLKHLGYKSVIVNLSDIYAMNAEPTQITVSLAISNRFSMEALEELYEGIKHACDRYNVDLVGGDTTSSMSGLVISVTAIGQAEKDDLVYRNGAKEGDLICVSGDLGGAYMGLQLLEREKRVYLENPEVQPNLEGETYTVGRQLKPEARKDIIEILKELKVRPTSMIDVSDGLSSDLLHICTQSEVGCLIFEDQVPISEQAYSLSQKFQMAPITAALSGGEDYELLFTINKEDKEKVGGDWNFTIIGEIKAAEKGYQMLTKGGNYANLNAQGWDALLKVKRAHE